MNTTIKPTMLEIVYATLYDNPNSTTRELADKCGMVHSRVSRLVQRLVSDGRAFALVKRKCRKSGRWMTPWRAMA